MRLQSHTTERLLVIVADMMTDRGVLLDTVTGHEVLVAGRQGQMLAMTPTGRSGSHVSARVAMQKTLDETEGQNTHQRTSLADSRAALEDMHAAVDRASDRIRPLLVGKSPVKSPDA